MSTDLPRPLIPSDEGGGGVTLEEFNSWKESIFCYLQEHDTYEMFLPGHRYSSWTPRAEAKNGLRIQELDPADLKTLKKDTNTTASNQEDDIDDLDVPMSARNGIFDDDSNLNTSTSTTSDSLVRINDALDKMIRLICDLCKSADHEVVSDHSTSLESIMDFLLHFINLETKHNNILQLSNIRLIKSRSTASCDYNAFYIKFRSAICTNLKRKGDRLKFLDQQVLAEDEILSPTFEEVIVLWCLEKIDPRLPLKVSQTFGHQLLDASLTLMDIQKDVFNYIPVLLQEILGGQDDDVDVIKVKKETVNNSSNNSGKDERTSDNEQNNFDFANDFDDSVEVKQELPLELDAVHKHKLQKSIKEEEEGGGGSPPVKKSRKRLKKKTSKGAVKKEPYVCPKCWVFFAKKEVFLDHMKIHENCENASPASEDEDTHRNIFDGEGFPCEECNKVFSKKAAYENHAIKHKGCFCYFCDEHFKSAKDRRMHTLEAHNGTEKYICHECGKEFGRKDSLGKHIKRHTVKTSKETWTCHICGKIFHIKESFNGHLLWHKERFKCDNCGRTYIGQNRLDNHVCQHYSCEECGKRFDKERNLKMHMRMHSGETMYPCLQCEALFDTKRKLGKHRNSAHRERRKYVCDECPKSFKGSAALKAHKLNHSGIRPYKCEHCDKSFIQKPHLTKHLLVHSNENPYPCRGCGQKFRSHGHVKYHIDTTKCGQDGAAIGFPDPPLPPNERREPLIVDYKVE